MNQIDLNLEKLAQFLDNKFEIFGFHFGVGFLIELIPGIGDIVAPAIAFYVFLKALEYKLSTFTIIAMLGNITFYFLIGLIPIFGDLIAAWWKPNIRNLNLVRRHIAENAQSNSTN